MKTSKVVAQRLISRWNFGVILGLAAAFIAASTPWAYSGVDWDLVFRGQGNQACVPHWVSLSEGADAWVIVFALGIAVSVACSLSRSRTQLAYTSMGAAVAGFSVIVGLGALRADLYRPLTLSRCTYEIDQGAWWAMASVLFVWVSAGVSASLARRPTSQPQSG